MANQDFQLSENDLVIKNGDFAVAESDTQHIEDTINAYPGWWKQFPAEGVGIKSWLGAPANTQEMSKAIRLQLQLDGYQVNNPTVKIDANGNLEINPNATL